jgi:hypothetical protein
MTDLRADEIFPDDPTDRLARLYALVDLSPEAPIDPADAWAYREVLSAALTLIRSQALTIRDLRRSLGKARLR